MKPVDSICRREEEKKVGKTGETTRPNPMLGLYFIRPEQVFRTGFRKEYNA